MNCLVLGGNGFIGSHLVDSLITDGHSVRIYDRRKPRVLLDCFNEVECIQGNLEDVGLIEDALKGIDVVFHLISTTVPSTSNADPVWDIQSNLVNTIKLFQIIQKSNVKKLVYFSSGGTVYGVPDKIPIVETHSLNPISSYGIVKVAIENYLHMFQHLHNLDYVVLRASNPYGERQCYNSVQGLVGALLWKTAHQETIDIYGDGSVVRDYIHVKDLAQLAVRAAQSSENGCFNAGSGTGKSINEVVEAIRKITGREMNIRRLAGRDFDVPKSVLDITKAKNAFNWSPNIGFEQGIDDTWHWIGDQCAAENPHDIERRVA